MKGEGAEGAAGEACSETGGGGAPACWRVTQVLLRQAWAGTASCLG